MKMMMMKNKVSGKGVVEKKPLGNLRV
jgi:hypothetical protein